VSYKDVVLGDSPSVYYRLGDTSAPAVPTNGLGVNAAMTGTVTFGQAGALGGDPDTAVSFPGSAGTDYLQTASSPGAAYDLGDGPFSIEFWYKTNSTAADRNPLSKGTASYIMRHLAGGTWAFRLSGTGNCFVTTAAFTDTTSWHHVVVTRVAATQPILYVDGVAQAGTYTARTFTNITTGFGIGVDVAAKPTGAWNGLVDEVALYKSVLSQSQVTAHYQAGLGLFGPLQPPALRRRPFLFGRRKRNGASQPLPAAAPAVTTQALPPQPRRRIRPITWRPKAKGHVTQPPTGPAFNGSYPIPPQYRTSNEARPNWPRTRRRGAQPPFAVTVTVTAGPLVPQARTSLRIPKFARAKARQAQPVPPQQTAVIISVPVQPPRRQLRPPVVPRGYSTIPVTVAVAVPPQPRRRIVRPLLRPRSRIAAPVPPQVIVVTAQTLPPQPATRRRPWPWHHFGRGAQYIPAQQAITIIVPVAVTGSDRPASTVTSSDTGSGVTGTDRSTASVASSDRSSATVAGQDRATSTVTS